MPRKRIYRRKKIMRRPKRFRRYHRRPMTIINKGLSPITPRFVTKLKYCDESSGNITSSTGVPHQQVFRLNSIYDPDLTGTGHQPVGRDQLATLYDKYRVFAVSYSVEVTGNTATDVPRLVVIPFDGSITSPGRTFAMEFPRAITREGSIGRNYCKIRGRISLPRLRGQTSSAYKGDDANQSLISTNPSQLLSLNLFISSVQSTTTFVGQWRITLVYHTELFDPAELTQS